MLAEFLTGDHARLDALLAECLAAGDDIPYAAYDEFRRGILRHIGMEERVLFPELRKVEGVTALERQLHRDHAAIAALLVPPPTHRELEQIATILETHNVLEEEASGLYAAIERIVADDLPALMQRVHAIPEIPVAPHSDTELLRTTIDQLLRDRVR